MVRLSESILLRAEAKWRNGDLAAVRIKQYANPDVYIEQNYGW